VTALLVGAAIGLLAASIIGGYQIRRAIYMRQFDTECREFGCHDTSDLEDANPEWVNRSNGVWPPIVVDLDAFIDAIDNLTRQQQLEDSAPWN
jgi:hypothetical protein